MSRKAADKGRAVLEAVGLDAEVVDMSYCDNPRSEEAAVQAGLLKWVGSHAATWEVLIVLYCIVLYCIVLYCIVLYCIVLYCIVLYCIVLYCIVLYCIVLYCIVLYCIVLYLLRLPLQHKAGVNGGPNKIQ